MPEYDEQGNPVEVIAAIQAGARENYNALMEAAVQRATDAVCDFDPDAEAYRARTEAWVRLALTVALKPALDDQVRGELNVRRGIPDEREAGG